MLLEYTYISSFTLMVYFHSCLVQVLDRVRYRVEWIRHQEREKKKLEDEKEKERGETQQLSIKQKLQATRTPLESLNYR